MGQRMLGVACACALAVLAMAPGAGATHSSVKKADKSDRSMVKGYPRCNAPSIDEPGFGGVSDACPAVPFASTVRFGPTGAARLKINRRGPGKGIADRAGENRIPGFGDAHPFDREANASGDVLISLSATDMRDDLDAPLSGLSNEELAYRFRLTDDACTGGQACTTPEQLTPVRRWSGASPANFCTAGACQFTTTLNTSAVEVDPDFLFGFYFNNTNASNLITAGTRMNMEESGFCTNAAVLCQGLLAGTPDGPDPSGLIRPYKAKKVQLAFVRDYVRSSDAVCGSMEPHDDPWDFSGCAPPVESSDLTLGSGASGKVTLKPGRSDTNREIKITAKLKDVRSGGLPFTQQDSVSVRFNTRVTHGECAGVACTREDQLAAVDGDCNNGTCKVKGLTALQLPNVGVSSVQIGPPFSGGGTNVTEQSVCLYDGPASDAGAEPIACSGVFVP